MAFFKDSIQAVLRLYTLLVHFVFLFIRLCRFRTQAPVLPVIATATLPPEPNQKLGAVTQGVIFWAQLLRGPPTTFRLSHGTPEMPPRAEWNSLLRVSPQDSDDDVVDISEPTASYDIGTEGLMSIMSIESSSDISICSSASTPPPRTPSPPLFPLAVPHIAVAEVEVCFNDLVSRDAHGFDLGRTFIREDSVKVTAKIHTVLAAIVTHTLSTDADDSPLSCTKLSFSQTTELPVTHFGYEPRLQEPNDDHSLRTDSDSTADAEELDWPLPLGPVFRLLEGQDAKSIPEVISQSPEPQDESNCAAETESNAEDLIFDSCSNHDLFTSSSADLTEATQNQSQNTSGSTASDDECVAFPASVLPLQITKRSSLPQSLRSSRSSPPASAPSSPDVSFAYSAADGESDRHSRSMTDLIALLDAEFDRNANDYNAFDMFVNCNVNVHIYGDQQEAGACSETEEEEHWSDVLSIESYAI